MKLFVAFHYHEEDGWIKDLIIPLIKDLDITVESGENMFGNIIVHEVPEKIRKSDCMIAFVTKSWIKNPWVRNELATAIGVGIPALEIRQKSIKIKEGISDGRQRIDFDPDRKEEMIVKLIPIIYEWKKKHDSRNLLILPENIMREAGKHIIEGYAKCTYQFKIGEDVTKLYEANLSPVANGIEIDIKNIPSSNAKINIILKGPDFLWYSGYQHFNLIPINLIKQI